MAEFSHFSDTQVDRFFEDWDEPEPKTKESTVLGISTADLFARYSYYTKLVKERTKWERDCNENVIDFQSILVGPAAERVPAVDELEIPIHVIKKKQLAVDSDPKPSSDTLACFPIRIEDISRIIMEKDTFNKFELSGVRFRLITFFGRICGVRRNERCNQRIGIYEVDDGSGRVQVHFNHLKKEFRECYFDVANAERMVRLKRNKMGSLSKDMNKLLNISRTRLRQQINYFSLGDRALVLGVPFLERDEVRVFGYEMHATSHVDCDFEIYFKDLLFDAYCEKYLVTK